MTLERYAAPIRSRKVSDIETDDVLRVLNPLWHTRSATASRLRGRIERVLDYAKAHGWRSGENPALWRGHLRNVLPAHNRLGRGHHAAMPYPDVPAFVQELQVKQRSMAARALEFLILTAARAGEVLGATWAEMDLERGLWTVPANRMKAGVEHRVPLSPRALAIVRALHEMRISDYVFPGRRVGRFQHGIRDAVAENEGQLYDAGFDRHFAIGRATRQSARDCRGCWPPCRWE
jgi:integrase